MNGEIGEKKKSVCRPNCTTYLVSKGEAKMAGLGIAETREGT